MFQFIRGNCVQTGQAGHAYVFDSMSGESYIFNRPLLSGSQYQVQLVTNIHTRKVVVRKVSKQTPAVQDAHDLARVPEDNEVRILSHLNALLHNPTYLLTGLTPRWSACISHEKIAAQSQGPRAKTECLQISYWKFCNAESLASVLSNWHLGSMGIYMEGKLFPVSFAARCIAQVCETLHFMYQAGPEAVYHGDLHAGNVFVHYTSHPGNDGLPNFYIGDFGWARTASEHRAESEACHKERGRKYPDGGYSSPCFTDRPRLPSRPEPAPVGERRRWDVEMFMNTVRQLARYTVVPWGIGREPPNLPPPSEQAVALEGLIEMLKFVDAQDKEMAACNPTSRPPYLVEVVRQAKRVEEFALKAEMYTESFDVVAEWGELQLEQSQREKPFVFTSEGLPTPPQTDMTATGAENYGKANIVGPWVLVYSE